MLQTTYEYKNNYICDIFWALPNRMSWGNMKISQSYKFEKINCVYHDRKRGKDTHCYYNILVIGDYFYYYLEILLVHMGCSFRGLFFRFI